MPATQSLPAFHEWLLVVVPEPTASCSIVLHGPASSGAPRIAEKIAVYLNEYDAEADGHWLAVPAELVATIAADPSQRALLGIGDGCGNCPPTSPCGLKKTLAALATRGHVVLDSPLGAAATRGMENVFHAGIGLPPDGLDDCHLIVNPALFPATCIAQVIADVFLEWLACEDRQAARFERL